jgi:ankyrin repeat protein
VEEYLDHGGNPKVTNCKGETALHIAAAHHQNEILGRLLPYFSEEEMDIRNMY